MDHELVGWVSMSSSLQWRDSIFLLSLCNDDVVVGVFVRTYMCNHTRLYQGVCHCRSASPAIRRDSHTTAGKLSDCDRGKTPKTSHDVKIRAKRKRTDERDEAKRHCMYGDGFPSLPSLSSSCEPVTGEDNSTRRRSPAVPNQTSHSIPASSPIIEDSHAAVGKLSDLDQGKTSTTNFTVKLRAKRKLPMCQRTDRNSDKAKNRHCMYGDSFPSLSAGNEPVTGENNATRWCSSAETNASF